MRALLAPAVAVVLALGLAGCDDEDAPQEPSVTDASLPESSDTGIQATGTLDGQRAAISRGNPTVILGDCDANDGVDDDLCILGRTIEGRDVDLVIENPAVLEAGTTFDIATCNVACDGVTDGVVAEVRVNGDTRPVTRGSMTVSQAADRYAAEFDLTLPFGDRLIGRFDVEPTGPLS